MSPFMFVAVAFAGFVCGWMVMDLLDQWRKRK